MKFSNVDDWQSSREREVEGVPCPIGKGRELIVRRAGARNREYMAGLASVKGDDIAAIERLFAATIVCGWRGLLDEQGAQVPYSIDACCELFAQCPDLGDHVARFAADRAHYHATEVEEDAERLKVIPGGRCVSASTRSDCASCRLPGCACRCWRPSRSSRCGRSSRCSRGAICAASVRSACRSGRSRGVRWSRGAIGIDAAMPRR